MEFKVGDRVRTTDQVPTSFIHKGEEGTVIYKDEDLIPDVLVEFDKEIPGGHDGGHFVQDRGKDGRCWWFRGQDLDFIETINSTTNLLTSDYYIDSEGFKTSKKNWDRGLNLI